MKNNLFYYLIALTTVCIIGCSQPTTTQTETGNGSDSTSVQTASLYICPMDTDVKSDKPGTCSKCGMDLELQK